MRCLRAKLSSCSNPARASNENKGKNLKNHQGGFTLIELAVVIVILAILAAVVVAIAGGGLGYHDYMECKGSTAVYHTYTHDGHEDIDHVANDPSCVTPTSHVPG